MLGWLRKLRSVPPIPERAWQSALLRYPFLFRRAEGSMDRLRALAAEFLRDKEFHGAHGFVITDEVALCIAAQAVLPILHLPGGLNWYDDFVGVVVHPAEALARRKVTDEVGVVHEYDEVIAGEAMDRGPVMLSWQAVLESGVTSEAGYNVVIHEFVHKIDMRDGRADGCPPLPMNFAGTNSARDGKLKWLTVMEAAYGEFREKAIIAERFGGEAPWLDPYGATSITEFFAVACETYFVNRERFAQEAPALLALFDAFFLSGRK
ncbi:zinc-dependent peptidase [Variovorax sp. J22R133]|uniref:M90 family metallopeptidase n=1 Tax=Variovorax brevis TaxID=3053503 RepID=UPI00257670EF|nr:M90 family metallopeptidase [Variovorax sp. J22R133]MDM0112670.1 zinc-dependent peptidase [Variovorax sp. J22R133]